MRRREFLSGTLGWAAVAGPLANAAALAAEESREPREKIKIAQIGVRHSHAAGKMEAVRRLSDDYEVVGIAERDANARAAAEKQEVYAGLAWLDEQAILSRDDVRVVIVETDWRDATEVARRAIEAGKHVHLDKPGGADHRAFRAMRERAAERGRIVQLGYMLRYNPAFELLARAKSEGWLGEIVEIDASMGKLADDALRKRQFEHPGHGMFELACHVIDAVVGLLGAPRNVVASAARSRAESDPTGALPDVQTAVFEYDHALAVVRCNHVDRDGGPRRRFEVVGTRGRIEIQPLESGRVTLSLAEPRGDFPAGVKTIQLPVPAGRYDGEFRDLARCVRGESEFRWDAKHDVATHAAALRAAGVEID